MSRQAEILVITRIPAKVDLGFIDLCATIVS